MNKLKQLRLINKLTQNKLAEKANVSQSTISRLENNETTSIPLKSLTKITKTFEVNITNLTPYLQSCYTYIFAYKYMSYNSFCSFACDIVTEYDKCLPKNKAPQNHLILICQQCYSGISKNTRKLIKTPIIKKYTIPNSNTELILFEMPEPENCNNYIQNIIRSLTNEFDVYHILVDYDSSLLMADELNRLTKQFFVVDPIPFSVGCYNILYRTFFPIFVATFDNPLDCIHYAFESILNNDPPHKKCTRTEETFISNRQKPKRTSTVHLNADIANKLKEWCKDLQLKPSDLIDKILTDNDIYSNELSEVFHQKCASFSNDVATRSIHVSLSSSAEDLLSKVRSSNMTIRQFLSCLIDTYFETKGYFAFIDFSF